MTLVFARFTKANGLIFGERVVFGAVIMTVVLKIVKIHFSDRESRL